MTNLRRSSRLLTKATSETNLLKKTVSPSKSKIIKSKATTEAKKKNKTKALAKDSPIKSVDKAVIKNIIANPVLESYPDELIDNNMKETVLQALNHLSEVDPDLKVIIDRIPVNPVDAFAYRRSRSSFESLLRSVIGQQISNKAAFSVFKKFVTMFGKPIDQNAQAQQSADVETPENSTKIPELAHLRFPEPGEVLEIDVETLRLCGVSQRKAEYIRALSSHFHESSLDDSALDKMSNEEISKSLTSIKGIGQWSVDMLLIFQLKRLDVLPTLDLKVKKSMCTHFKVPFTKNSPKHNDLVNLAKIWEPYRSIASYYMWKYDT